MGLPSLESLLRIGPLSPEECRCFEWADPSETKKLHAAAESLCRRVAELEAEAERLTALHAIAASVCRTMAGPCFCGCHTSVVSDVPAETPGWDQFELLLYAEGAGDARLVNVGVVRELHASATRLAGQLAESQARVAELEAAGKEGA